MLSVLFGFDCNVVVVVVVVVVLGELGLDDVTEFVDRSKSPSSPLTSGVDSSPLQKVPQPHLYHRARESIAHAHNHTDT